MGGDNVLQESIMHVEDADAGFRVRSLDSWGAEWT